MQRCHVRVVSVVLRAIPALQIATGLRAMDVKPILQPVFQTVERAGLFVLLVHCVFLDGVGLVRVVMVHLRSRHRPR
jgi:hypothetical protein